MVQEQEVVQMMVSNTYMYLYHSIFLSFNSDHHVSCEFARSEVTPSHERGNRLEYMMMCASTLDHLRSYLSFGRI